MAKIAARRIRFSPVPGATGYKLYFGSDPYDFSYAEEHADLGSPPIVNGKHEVSINEQEQLIGLEEGIYDLALTAYDEAGNESDFVRLENVPLDFQPPAPPVDAEIVAG